MTVGVKKPKLDELVLMRAIACLSVLMVHISAIPFENIGGPSLSLYGFAMLNRAFKFTTPVFVFLSGMMQFYNYADKTFDYGSFMKKRFGPIFWPYLAAVLVYELVLGFLGVYPMGVKETALRFLLGSSNYHLYFVVIIMQLYLLMPIILKAFRRLNDKVVLGLSLLVTLISREFIVMPYSDRIFLNYLFFFILGCFFAGRLELVRKKLVSLWVYAAGFYGLMAAYYGWQFIGYTLWGYQFNIHLTSLTWFVFCLSAILMLYGLSAKLVTYEGYEQRVAPWARPVNAASYWIYLIHPMVLYVSTKIGRMIGLKSNVKLFTWNVLWVFGSMLFFAFLYPRLQRVWQDQTHAIKRLISSFSES